MIAFAVRTLRPHRNHPRHECCWCGARTRDHRENVVEWDREFSEDENRAAMERYAQEHDLDLKDEAEKLLAMKNVPKPGSPVREYAHLCHACYQKVRTCQSCEFIDGGNKREHGVQEMYGCHYEPINRARTTQISDPRTWWCGDWQQRVVFTDESLTTILRGDEPAAGRPEPNEED
jgi:hypothetical protein